MLVIFYYFYNKFKIAVRFLDDQLVMRQTERWSRHTATIISLRMRLLDSIRFVLVAGPEVSHHIIITHALNLFDS